MGEGFYLTGCRQVDANIGPQEENDEQCDGNVGYFDNEIYMTGLKSSDDTKVDDIRPQVGRVVSLDDPGVKVLSSSRLLTGNITNWHRTRSNANDRNFRYYDNEIDIVDLMCLKGTKVNNIEPWTGRLVFPDDSGVIAWTSDNQIDMADLESLGDTKVGIIMSQGRRPVLPAFLKCSDFSIVFFKNI